MKTSSLLFLFLPIILLVSCQKEISSEAGGATGTPGSNPTPIPTNTAARVKTYTEDITAGGQRLTSTFNLSYDDKGRITSMISATTAGDKFVYTYLPNNRYTMELFNANVLSIHGTFFINSTGLVDSILQYNDTKDTSSEKFMYDANKKVILHKSYEFLPGQGAVPTDVTTYEYDANRNVIKETGSNGTISYTYYDNLLNTLDLGDVYYTKNKNLTRQTKQGGETLEHSYTFDSLQRLSTEKVISSAGYEATKTYTY